MHIKPAHSVHACVASFPGRPASVGATGLWLIMQASVAVMRLRPHGSELASLEAPIP